MRLVLSPEPREGYRVTSWSGFNIVSQRTEGSEERKKQEMAGYGAIRTCNISLCSILYGCGPQLPMTMTIAISQTTKEIVTQKFMKITKIPHRDIK